MKKLLLSFISALLVVSTLVAQSGEPGFESYWHNGFIVKSTDGNFNMKFGGRIMTDFAWFSYDNELEDLFGGTKSGVEFRRGRFFNSGTVYGKLNYKIQLDFTSGAAVFKDVYIGIKGIPGIGNLRVGHFKEPLRLEVLTSSKYMTFMERAPGVSFVPERNVGLMAFNHTKNNKVTWAIGVFRRSDKQGNDKVSTDELNVTGRISTVPFMNTEKKQVLHLGVAMSHREPGDGNYSVNSRPNSHLAPKFINTHTIAGTDHINVFSVEAALVAGPLSIQGEFIDSDVNAMNEGIGKLDHFNFYSYYVYASYFLTGESRKYKNTAGAFSRVSPKNNFGQGGSGAWEVAIRYSKTDLTDKVIEGGEMTEFTLGLNWYLNPVSRIMLNYSIADLPDLGKANVIGTRFQIDF